MVFILSEPHPAVSVCVPSKAVHLDTFTRSAARPCQTAEKKEKLKTEISAVHALAGWIIFLPLFVLVKSFSNYLGED